MRAWEMLRMASSPLTPISPAAVTDWHPDNLPAYLSNGLVGLRIGPVPLINGTCVVSGFEGRDPAADVEAFSPAPFPYYGDITIGLVSLGGSPDRARLGEQRYDFATGELHTRFEFDAPDARATVDVLNFCSRTMPTVVAQEIELRVDRPCDLQLRAGIDPTHTPGRWAKRMVTQAGTASAEVDGVLQWLSLEELSAAGFAYVTTFEGADAERTTDPSVAAPLATTYRWRAEPGRSVRLRQLTAAVPSVVHSTPELQAVRTALDAHRLGFERLRRDNAKAWESIWRSRIVVDAPAGWQAMIDAACFYLWTSVHPSSPSSMSLFGLSYWPNYHYYRGHVMWDIETFAVPPLLLTMPDSARAILDYRFRNLEAARNNARSHGYVGAQFPWESSATTGGESAPVEVLPAAIEHHVTFDVALAFASYPHATGDMDFAAEAVWPVLRDACRWLASRVEHTERGFEIFRAGGAAELDHPVDNSVFVNAAAIRTLEETMALAERLGKRCPKLWPQIANGLVIPRRPNGVLVNHDGYDPNADKAATPEAPAAIFPVGYRVDANVERSTFEYFVKRAEEYVGSPMLSALLPVYAARLGDRNRALELLDAGYRAFVREPYTVTLELSPTRYPDQPPAGPFTANIGGFLMALLYGFGGLRLGAGDPDSWCERAICLPAGWKTIHVDHLYAREEAFSFTAEQGAPSATLRAVG